MSRPDPGSSDSGEGARPTTPASSRSPMSAQARLRFVALLLVVVGAVVAFALSRASSGSGTEAEIDQRHAPAPPRALETHCDESIGRARVVEVVEGIWVAIGYDLANTTVIRTEAGNVVVDPGMSPERARAVREAIMEVSPLDTAAIVYTHSHIDHVGGASVWMSEGTEIWSTDAFIEHFLKQYGFFREAESRRALGQFGAHVPIEAIPCSALGRRPDVLAAIETGARLPTRTFSGETEFEIGGVTFELVEAHGETHDQLFVHLPEREVLLPGDNYYRAFPNLYTIRGTSPRPVDTWIASLDAMRRRDPAHLIPSHTIPVSGRAEVRAALRDYRDGIQWVRDRVVAGANAGRSIDSIAEEAGLPPRLVGVPALRELYGQIDWSARAIYTNHIGWFDERPETLYPLPVEERARRTVEGFGGSEAVVEKARAALERGEARWATHLLSLLRDAGHGSDDPESPYATTFAAALEAVAAGVGNSNGRGYLLETAYLMRGGESVLPEPRTDEQLLDAVPLSTFFEVMPTRLKVEESLDVHESVRFELADAEPFIVTVRHGVAEVTRGEPLPGTPSPLAVLRSDTPTWRRLATRQMTPMEAVASGKVSVDGDPIAFYRFIDRFERGL